VQQDAVTIYTIARETTSRIAILHKRAIEGKDLHAAKEFCSYLQWSGILKLLRSNCQPEPLPVDGVLIGWKCDQLLSVVNDQFRQATKVVSLELSQLEAIDHKLDLIAGRIAQLSPPIIETTEAVSTALHVIEGGVIQSGESRDARQRGAA